MTRFPSGYPIVKFVSGIEEIIGSEKWVVSTPGGGTVTRRQLPLKLAWAVSIHKSQVTEAKKKIAMVTSCNNSVVDEKRVLHLIEARLTF